MAFFHVALVFYTLFSVIFSHKGRFSMQSSLVSSSSLCSHLRLSGIHSGFVRSNADISQIPPFLYRFLVC